MSEVLGTLAFVAPEVVQKSYSEKCDCWSFGIMVFMQLTQGQHPYGGSWRGRSNLPNRQLLMRLQDPPRLELLCTADARGSELVARLLAHEPQQRLSAQEALQMAWLRPKSIRRVERSCNLSHREQSLMRRSLSSYKDLTSFDKAVLLMATQFQKREVLRKSSDIFVSTDTDKSGYLSENEIKGALQAVGLSTVRSLGRSSSDDFSARPGEAWTPRRMAR